MKNGNPKMVEVRGKDNISFKCKVCGQVWYKYPTAKRYNWQCPSGCKLKDLVED